jgi:uncharacterized membrane protein
MKNILVLLNPLDWTFFKTEFQRWFVASILFSIVLMVARIVVSGNLIFTFLLWNLFLAFVPYAVSNWLSRNTKVVQNRLMFCAVFVVWLLFIPNSFYIITDLFHLGRFVDMHLWFDLTMILSFAWNGILLGVLSVRQMEKIMEAFLSKRTKMLFIYVVMFLNALGVYIGRYLRFNSWDVVTDPSLIIKEVLNLVMHPIEYKYVWSMIICFSVFMTLLYFVTRISANDVYANERQ